MSSVVRNRTRRHSLLKSGGKAAGPGATIEVPAAITPDRRPALFAAVRPWLPAGCGRITITSAGVRIEGVPPACAAAVRAALDRGLRGT
jgi:hypothetical protein